ncbi:unnamed protein product [Musa acuminata var. zebrina]
MAKKGVTSQGRRKIEIKKIQNEDARHVCFSKRKAGIFAKASDISTLCGADVALVVYSPAGNPYSFGSPAVDPVVDRFLSASLIHGGSAHDVGRSHLTQQLNQQYMEVSKQLEASKARKMILQERLAGVVQSQEIEWAKNNIDHLGLEQLERLKDAFERLKGRADARIQDILGTGQRMALHQPQPPPPSMMGFGVPPVGKLLSSSLDLIQERFICSMHGFICVRVREQTWTPHAAVKNDDEKKTGQGTHRIHLLLRRQLRHPKPARISRSKQGFQNVNTFSRTLLQVGAPPDVVARLSALAQELESPWSCRQEPSSDPELDHSTRSPTLPRCGSSPPVVILVRPTSTLHHYNLSAFDLIHCASFCRHTSLQHPQSHSWCSLIHAFMSTLAHTTTHSEKARCSSLTSCSVCMHYAVICSPRLQCFPLLVHVHVVAYKAQIWKNKLLHSNSNSSPFATHHLLDQIPLRNGTSQSYRNKKSTPSSPLNAFPLELQSDQAF